MLNRVKDSLHYSLNLYDDEISAMIEACKMKAELSGVLWNDSDETIVHMTCSYVKWQLDFQGKGDKWKVIYEGLIASLALNPHYSAHHVY